MVKDGVISIFYGVASRASFFVVNYIAVRLLSVSDYGVFAFFLAIASSIATISTVGLGVTCNTIAAKYSKTDPDLVRSALGVSLLASLVLAVLVTALYVPFMKLSFVEQFGGSGIFLILFLISWSMSSYGVFEGVLYGTSQYRDMLKSSMITLAISLPLAVLMTMSMGLRGAVLGVVVGRVLAAVAHSSLLHRRQWLQFSLKKFMARAATIKAAFLSVSLPTAMSGVIAGPAIAFGMGIVESSAGQVELGYFNWVYQIYLIAVFVPGALGHFFISKLSASDLKGSRLLRRMIQLNFSFSVVMCCLLWLLKPIALGTGGTAYVEHAGRVYDAFLICMLLYGINVSFISYWPSVGKGWIQFAAQFVWVTTVVCITSWVVDSEKAAALAIGFCGGFILQAIFQCSVFVFFEKRSS